MSSGKLKDQEAHKSIDSQNFWTANSNNTKIEKEKNSKVE